MSKNIYTKQEREILEQSRDLSLTYEEIGRIINRKGGSVKNEYRKNGGRKFYTAETAEKNMQTRKQTQRRSYEFKNALSSLYLSLEERKALEEMKDSHLSAKEIGEKIGRPKTTIVKEYFRGGGRLVYDAKKSHEEALNRRESGYEKIRTHEVYKKSDIKIKKRQIERDASDEFLNSEKNVPNIPSLAPLPSYIPKLPLKIWIERFKQEESPKRLNWKKEKKYFDFWMGHLGERIAIDLDPLTIEQCAENIQNRISQKTKNYLSESTKCKYLLMLSSLYTIAIKDWKWAVFNPLSSVRMTPRKSKNNMKDEIKSDEGFLEFKKNLSRNVHDAIDGVYTLKHAAKVCGISKNSFRNVLGFKENVTIYNIFKVVNCLGFELKLVKKEKDLDIET